MKYLGVLLCVCLAGCLGSANRPLQLISGGGPEYPQQARERGLEGQVVVRYDVDDGGHVRNAQVVTAEPAGIFDAAALLAVSSWRFKPALRDGQPQVEAGRVSTVTFKLGSGSEYADYD